MFPIENARNKLAKSTVSVVDDYQGNRRMRSTLNVFLLISILAMSSAHAAKTAPEFISDDATDWLNSAPLTLADLRGKVVLIDFWTFECWNCYRSFPWLNSLEQKFDNEQFQIIGIHSPEFEHEKDRMAVAKHIEKFGLKHPVMIDNAHQYWKAIGNRYWPAFYLIDGNGIIHQVFIGETHVGDKQAKKIEAAIQALIDVT